MLEALRNLDVWRKACRLSVNVYDLTSSCNQHAYRDRVTRSALSIASNIAEGYERDTLKDRVRFLYIAKGSCGECWTQLLIGTEAGLIDKEPAREQIAAAHEISRMLRALIISLQE